MTEHDHSTEEEDTEEETGEDENTETGEDIIITCPFCDTTVFTDLAGNDGIGERDWNLCEHVVLAHSWGVDFWSGEDTEVHVADPKLEAKLRRLEENASDPEDLSKDAIKLLRRSTPPDMKSELETAGGYVERGDGGPTYNFIFQRLTPKDSTTLGYASKSSPTV